MLLDVVANQEIVFLSPSHCPKKVVILRAQSDAEKRDSMYIYTHCGLLVFHIPLGLILLVWIMLELSIACLGSGLI